MTYRTAVVLLAGGMGARMQSDVNKVYLRIQQRGMIDYSFETTVCCPVVTEVVLVTRPQDADFVERLLESVTADGPKIRTTSGGASRHESERAGIVALRHEIEAGDIDVIAVHDGARPFMSQELLLRVLDEAAESGGAIPACPVEDTLYALDQETFVDSSDYVWSQTPQAFNAKVLIDAHDAAHEAEYQGMDTAEIIEKFSEQKIRVVPGDPNNIKVTYQHDMSSAELNAESWN